MKTLLVAALLPAVTGGTGNLRTRHDDAPGSLEFLSERSIHYELNKQKNYMDPQVQNGKGSSGGGRTQVQCNGPTTPFDSTVLVEFDGNPDDVSSNDIIFLEQSFQQTYNDLSRRICDDEDRIVVSASALSQEGSQVIRNGGLSYSIKFAVDLTCRGCDPATATAFSPPVGGSTASDVFTMSGRPFDAPSVDTDTLSTLNDFPPVSTTDTASDIFSTTATGRPIDVPSVDTTMIDISSKPNDSPLISTTDTASDIFSISGRPLDAPSAGTTSTIIDTSRRPYDSPGTTATMANTFSTISRPIDRPGGRKLNIYTRHGRIGLPRNVDDFAVDMHRPLSPLDKPDVVDSKLEQERPTPKSITQTQLFSGREYNAPRKPPDNLITTGRAQNVPNELTGTAQGRHNQSGETLSRGEGGKKEKGTKSQKGQKGGKKSQKDGPGGKKGKKGKGKKSQKAAKGKKGQGKKGQVDGKGGSDMQLRHRQPSIPCANRESFKQLSREAFKVVRIEAFKAVRIEAFKAVRVKLLT